MTLYKQSHHTTSDNKKLYKQEWMPEKDPKAIILYIHGLGSHGGRMDHWAKRFNELQLGFITYDQRGHGRSDMKRGKPTHFRFYVSDVREVMEEIRQEYPNIQVVLYGHSMGGSIAINYVISTSYTADALIVTSPWLKLKNPPSAGLRKLLKPLVKLTPWLTLSNGLDAADISRDPEEVRKYKEDPLVHNKISIGLFNSTYEAGYTALRNVYKINCPFLIMHGKGDKITSFRASEEYVMNTSDRTTLKLWDDAYHELHHEPIRDEVFTFISEWLKKIKIL